MKIHSLLFTLIGAHTAASTCPVGWENATNVWMTNQDKFKPPSCYQFTVTTHTISSSSAISRVVSVKNGVALGGDMSLADYMEEISTACYMMCPLSGAACRITYYSAGYPYQILIDENQSLVGEERNVEITNFTELECDDIPDLPITDAPSDAISDPPSDALSNVPSDVPTLARPPNESPVDFPVSQPIDSPVAVTPTDVSNINGGETSSALGLSFMPMVALASLLLPVLH